MTQSNRQHHLTTAAADRHSPPRGGMVGWLKRVLAEPATRGLDLDDPATTELRRHIVRTKPGLRQIYEEWYALLAAALPQGGPALELGSGGGFAAEVIPELITSDVFACPGVQRVIDARELPFAAGELRGIIMTNVFHHVPQPRRLLAEAARCLRPGGALAMIEPWMTPWSELVYTRLHHEPFEKAAGWEFPAGGPLSSSNGALPWIVFHRDRAVLAAEYPQLRLESVRPLMPLRYLLAGGVSLRALVPGWTWGLWRGVERALSPCMNWLGLFACIVMRRVPPASSAGG